jgi:predicted dehydrogenase
MNADPVKTGILGCGSISDVYLEADDRFDVYDIVACADIDVERAEATAANHGLRSHDPDGLRADADVELVVNLTPPSVHAETCERLLAAGKHVYVEKPLAVSPAGARRILDAAAEHDLLVGSAPDTAFGAGLQTAQAAVADGIVGDPIGATAVWASGGHESWHPNPDLYYEEGGGPLFDMGPYYVTALVALLGPARRVTGSVSRARDQREITSEPRRGERIDVHVPTHETAIVDFESGATATLLTSFDTPGGSTLPSPAFELYGTDATLALPDPDTFEGPVRVQSAHDAEAETLDLVEGFASGRGAGVADLAFALRTDWDQRMKGTLGSHVLEILDGIREASESGEHVTVESTVDRPAPLPAAFPDGIVD